MTFPEESNRALRQLQILAPDAARAARLRTHCHAQLARARTRTGPPPAERSFAHRVLAPAAVGGLCALYLASLITNLLRLTRGL